MQVVCSQEVHKEPRCPTEHTECWEEGLLHGLVIAAASGPLLHLGLPQQDLWGGCIQIRTRAKALRDSTAMELLLLCSTRAPSPGRPLAQ